MGIALKRYGFGRHLQLSAVVTALKLVVHPLLVLCAGDARVHHAARLGRGGRAVRRRAMRAQRLSFRRALSHRRGHRGRAPLRCRRRFRSSRRRSGSRCWASISVVRPDEAFEPGLQGLTQANLPPDPIGRLATGPPLRSGLALALLASLRAVLVQQQRVVVVERGLAGRAGACRRACTSVEASRSAPRTTWVTPCSASSSTTDRW